MPAPLLLDRDGSPLGRRGLRGDGVCRTVRKGRPHGAPKGLINLPMREVWVHLLKDFDRPRHADAFVYSILPHKNINDHLLAPSVE